jgi:hypothetical protein
MYKANLQVVSFNVHEWKDPDGNSNIDEVVDLLNGIMPSILNYFAIFSPIFLILLNILCAFKKSCIVSCKMSVTN